MSNIWTAASEGDLVRVQHFIVSGTSPNTADENSYTPIHAAASWSHIEILEYLLNKGGDINILDSDGETPLFLVETAEMASNVIRLGGDPSIRNNEGLSAAQSLDEDYPHISLYLRSLTGETQTSTTNNQDSINSEAMQTDIEESTDSLIYRVKMIMEASERGELTSEETDEKLREVVEEVVVGRVEEGRKIGEGMVVDANGTTVRERDEDGAEEGKGKKRKEEPAR